MYPRRDVADTKDIEPASIKDQPWLEWGRPEGGFLDLGCVCDAKYTGVHPAYLKATSSQSDREMVYWSTFLSQRYAIIR